MDDQIIFKLSREVFLNLLLTFKFVFLVDNDSNYDFVFIIKIFLVHY